MAGGFCPQCGTQRQSNLRFCANCGFDFWKAAQELGSGDSRPTTGASPSGAPPTTAGSSPTTSLAPGPPSPGPRRTSRLTFILVAAILLVAAAGMLMVLFNGSPGSSGPPLAGANASTPAAPSFSVPNCTASQHQVYQPNGQIVCADNTPEPTPSGPSTTALNTPVSITCNGTACMDVTVAKVAFASVYRDPQGIYNDTPDVKGDVFMAVYITYKATGPNADYGEFDWGIYVNDVAGNDPAFVMNGPKPELGTGQLPQGKSAVGWVVYEVPATGRITIAYQPGLNGAIFEVTLRAK